LTLSEPNAINLSAWLAAAAPRGRVQLGRLIRALEAGA
jgi:hypothetical protein